MLIQHEETERIYEIEDGLPVPRGYRQVAEAIRVSGKTPSAVNEPVEWRKWWLAINRGKTWSDADRAWRAEVS